MAAAVGVAAIAIQEATAATIPINPARAGTQETIRDMEMANPRAIKSSQLRLKPGWQLGRLEQNIFSAATRNLW
jgi:hypothetical protein